MKRSSSWIAVLPSLVIPVCIGLMMFLGLSYLIDQGTISNELVLRYLTGHPVSEVTIGMFFIGIASLGLIAKNIFEQFGAERKITLKAESGSELDADLEATEELKVSKQVGDRAVVLGNRLHELPVWMQEHYLWQRLINALHSIHRSDSTSSIEDELKYLADLDLDRQQQRYALVRILIWATPMLGFLGTVLGISQALGGINVGPDNNFQQMMDGLRGSLYVAFDTTALALTLSIVLMFGQFLIERFESQLLVLVDQRAKSEVAVQFDMTDSDFAYEKFASDVLEASRESVAAQTEIWRKSIRAAEQAWVSTLTQANSQVQGGLSEALDDNVANLAHYLGEAIERADNAMAHRWQQWQVTLSENARLMETQQRQLCEQTDVVLKVLTQSKAWEIISPEAVQNPATTAPISNPTASPNVAQPEQATSSNRPSVDRTQSIPLRSTAKSTINEPAKNSAASEQAQPPAGESQSAPATIRFENYQPKAVPNATEKTAKRQYADVILPIRSLASRSVRQAPGQSPSKKSA